MKPVIIIAIAFGLLIPITAFAAEGYFENDHGKQVSRVPTVCIFQPDDSRIDKQRWNNWYLESSHAIQTWESVLKQSGSGNWNISVVNVPISELDRLNYGECDITVKFVEKIPYKGQYVFGIAYYGTGYIEIAYSSFYSCGTVYDTELNIIVNSYCLTDDFFRSKQMANTLKHEFGHIIGLGHYRGYDSSITQNWYDTGVGAPSIMAWIEPNEEWREISQIDVKEVRKIYGNTGFGKFRNNDMPIFHDRVIPETIVESSQGTTITLSGNSQTTVLIDGNVPDKLYKRGVYLEIIIQNPYGSTEYKATSVSKTRHSYSYHLTIDSSSPSGTYKIAHQFDGQIFYREEIHVTKIPSTFSASSQKNNEREEIHQQNVAALVKAKQAIEQKQLKNEAQILQDKAYQKLNDLKKEITDAEDSLIQLGSKTPEQKKIIDKAWKLLKINKKTLNDVEEQFQKGDGQFGAEYYESSKTWYNLKEKDSQKFGDNLKDISKLIVNVEKLQKQTCFLWWCW